MGQLEDDIARVAALRGRRDVADLLEEAKRPAPITWAELQACLQPHDMPDKDLAFYDELPERIRAFLIGVDLAAPPNATMIYALWHRVRDESLVIEALRATIKRNG